MTSAMACVLDLKAPVWMAGVQGPHLKPMAKALKAGCALSTALVMQSSASRTTTLLSANSLLSAALCCTSSSGMLVFSAKVSQNGALITSCLLSPACERESGGFIIRHEAARLR